MPRKPTTPTTKKGVVYRFKIDAYSPETFPMGRLAEYMGRLALILGESANVHFERLEPGSTTIATRIEREAVPKVRASVFAVRRGDGSARAMEAYAATNKLLREDNAVASLKYGATLLEFPGRAEAKEEFTSVRQRGHIDGKLVGIRGRDDTVHLSLVTEGRQISGLYTSAFIARQLKWGDTVRLFGRGKWSRDSDGTWSLDEFKVESYDPLDDAPLSVAIAELRAIPTEWGEDAYNELTDLRHGPKGKRNGGH